MLSIFSILFLSAWFVILLLTLIKKNCDYIFLSMIHVCDIIIDIVCYISIRARFIATAAICGTVGRWVGGSVGEGFC